jgi:peptidoglycan DL-endopeptidase CwlO
MIARWLTFAVMLAAKSWRSFASLGLVLFALTASLVAPSVASADPVSDKREEARREAEKLEQLAHQAEVLTEEYNDAVLKQQQIQTEVDATTIRAEEANAQLEQRRDEMAAFAIDAYVMSGTEAQVPSMLKHDPNSGAKVQEYADSVIGDRPKLIKQFRQAKADAEKQIEDLNKAKAEADEASKAVDVKMKEAQAAVDEQTNRRNQVQGELADLLREEEEARSGAAPGTSNPPRRAGGPAPAVGSGASFAVAAAKTQLGVPYKWAGDSPEEGFDCSGFVLWAWRHGGKNLPHSSKSMYSMSTKISLSQAQPGDLVFYGNGGVSHVALYIGNNQIIHSPRTGSVVHITKVDYWSAFIGVGRV